MLTLTDDQQMLREAARRFLEEHAPVAQLRALRDADDATGFDRATWARMAEMGWAGVMIASEHGGQEFGAVGAAVLCEEMGRTLTASPFLSSAVLAAVLLTAGGTRHQQRRWLPAIAAGSALITLAIDERPKHDPAATALNADRTGDDGYELDGFKTFVADGHVADAVIVAGRTRSATGEFDGLTLFLVDPKSTGVSIETVRHLDSRRYARIGFDRVEVGAGDVIGPLNGARTLLERGLDAGRIALAAELSGIAQEAFRRTIAFITERHQFGKPVGSFQALQHRAAELYCEIETVKSAVLAAAQAYERDPVIASPLVSLAKAKASRVAQRVANEAVQMHGGMGMTDALDIGLFMKRARVAGEMLGDAAFHGDRVARAKGF